MVSLPTCVSKKLRESSLQHGYSCHSLSSLSLPYGTLVKMRDVDQQHANDVAELRRQFTTDMENLRGQCALLADQIRGNYTKMVIHADARALVAEEKLAYWMKKARGGSGGGGGGGGGKALSGEACCEERVKELISSAVAAERGRMERLMSSAVAEERERTKGLISSAVAEERKRAKELSTSSAVAKRRERIDGTAGFDASSGPVNTKRLKQEVCPLSTSSAVAENRGGLVGTAGFDASSDPVNTKTPKQEECPWKPTRRGNRGGKKVQAKKAEVRAAEGGGEDPSSVP